MYTHQDERHVPIPRTKPDGTVDSAASEPDDNSSRYSRRTVLGSVTTAASIGVVGLAGCLEDDKTSSEIVTDPIALDGGKTCDVCGMVIADHAGPNGQVFYHGDHPPERDGPARYDSLNELVIDRAATVDKGHDPAATYMTDYAAVEYELTERDEGRAITSRVAPETFVEWQEAVYVVDSGVVGAMGPDPIPFSDRDAAQSFVDTEGGRIVEADALTVELVSSL